MVRAHSRASTMSVTPGNSRRSSTAAANSPRCSNTARIAAASASETTNFTATSITFERPVLGAGSLPIKPSRRDPVRLPGVLEHLLGLTYRLVLRACRTANLDKIAATEHQNVICVLAAGFDLLVRGPRSAGRTS
jgi:hypothetical protein